MKRKNERIYDEKEFLNIVGCINNKKWDKTSFLLEEYIKKYPNDERAKLMYIQSSVANLEFEEASQMLELLEISNEKNKDRLIDLKIRILYGTEKYSECLELLEENYEFYNNNFTFVTMLKKKLDILEENEYTLSSYGIKQIINYSDELAIEHIKEHHQCKEYLDSNSKFNDEFDIEKAYYDIKKLLPNEIRRYCNFFQNLTIFKLPRNGYVDDVEVDYIEVISIHNTNEIITMYPYQNKEKAHFYDITPKIEIESNQKVKKISRIDKFNQKYGFKS